MAVKIPTIEELFKVGAHFGHSKSRSDARSHRYVYTYRNKISIIDLGKTISLLEKALEYIEEKSKAGGVFLFVGTKLQAKDKVKETAVKLGQPYIIERWPGGLLTNYEILSKTIRKMIKSEADLAENKLDYLKKKEKVKLDKDLKKANLTFGGLKKMEKKPDVLIVIDAKQEANAIAEAQKSGIGVVALCDTNANPKTIDYPIVANDDSQATIGLILDLIAEVIEKNPKPVVQETPETDENKEVQLEGKPGVKEEEKSLEKKKAKKAVKKVKK